MASVFWYALYQQPPGMTLVRQPDGTLLPAMPPGKLRIRLLAGSLIIARGNLPQPSRVKVTLGYMATAGIQVRMNTKPLAALADMNAWRFHFHPEHVQANLFPIAILLTLPWVVLRSRRRQPWMCPNCRYDLRGAPSPICPECGVPGTTG